MIYKAAKGGSTAASSWRDMDSQRPATPVHCGEVTLTRVTAGHSKCGAHPRGSAPLSVANDTRQPSATTPGFACESEERESATTPRRAA
eukprot:5090003-Prymnesium_polylepis.1